MKTKRTLLIAIAFLSVSILTQAQTVTNKDRFELSTTQNKIIMASNSEAELDISILKSKRYKNAKVQLLTQNLPQGVDVSIEKDELAENLYHLNFNSDASVKEGDYTVIVFGSHYSKKRGVAVSLKLSNDSATVIASTQR